MTGKVIDTYYYDAFGNIMEEVGDTNNPYRYAGYQYDAETGLYYLNARMYDPKIARFLQEDTYSGDPNDPLSLNLYTYCQNDPLTYDDPSGHFRIAIGAGLGFLIGAGASMISDAVSGEFSLKKNWKKYLGAGVQGGVIGATAGATMGASLLTMGATGLGAGAAGNTANQVIRNSGFNNFSAKELAVSSVATGVALPAGKAASGLASKAAEKFVSQVLQKTAQGGIIGGTAGSAGGFAGNVTDQTWDIASGTKGTFDTGSLIHDTSVGFISGFGIGGGIGYLGTKLPTNTTKVNKPTNQVTRPVQGNLNNETGLINSPANRVGNNLPAVIDRRTAALQKMLKAAQGEGTGPVIELPAVQEKSLLPVKVGTTALQTYYPPNKGALGTTQRTYLMPGQQIDRIGELGGKYFSPVGTPIEMRALPSTTDLSQYNAFEVLKPIEVESSTIAPAFNQTGLGTQFRSPVNAKTLIKRKIIKKLR